jgi:hypothetical protein
MILYDNNFSENLKEYFRRLAGLKDKLNKHPIDSNLDG